MTRGPWLHAKGGHAKRVVLVGPVHKWDSELGAL